MSLRFFALLVAAVLIIGCENADKNQAPEAVFDYDGFTSGVVTTGEDEAEGEGTWVGEFFIQDDGRSSNSEDEVFESGLLAVATSASITQIQAGGSTGIAVSGEVEEVGAAEEGDGKLKLYKVTITIEVSTIDDNGAGAVSTANYSQISLSIQVSDGAKGVSFSGTIQVSRNEEDPA